MNRNERKVVLLTLVGLPGAGKTYLCSCVQTYCSDESFPLLLKKEDQLNDGIVCSSTIRFIHVSYDEMIDQSVKFGAQANRLEYKQFRHCMLEVIDALVKTLTFDVTLRLPERLNAVSLSLMKALPQSSSQAVCLLIDDNMYYRSMRYEVFQIARKYLTGYGQVYLDTTLSECMKRNRLRGHDLVDESTIVRMSEHLEIPDSSIYAWEQNSVIVTNCDETSLRDVYRLISLSLAQPVKALDLPNESEKQVSRETTAKDITHQSDLTLRHRVRVEMDKCKSAGCSKAELKGFGLLLNSARQEAMKFIKENPGILKDLTDVKQQVELIFDKELEKLSKYNG